MKVKVATWGNSSAVRLPKAIVQELGLEPGQELDISVEAGEARLKPVARVPRYTLAELIAEMKRLGPENEPPTVEWGPDVGAEVIDDDYSRRVPAVRGEFAEGEDGDDAAGGR